MDERSIGREASAFQRTMGDIVRRWWIAVGVVLLVGIGASLTAISAARLPRYTELATFQIVAMPSGATNYDGYMAQARAESAEEAVASTLIGSSSFDSALVSRLGAAGLATNSAAVRGAVAGGHSGDIVTLTVHWATKAGAESVVGAALAEISAEVANGDVAATDDTQLRIVVTSMPGGAVVDQADQQVAWHGIALRLALALVLGVALMSAAWLWEGRRRERLVHR